MLVDFCYLSALKNSSYNRTWRRYFSHTFRIQAGSCADILRFSVSCHKVLLNQKVKISSDRTIISYFAIIHYLTLILVMFIGNYQQKREASDGTWYLFVCVCFWTVTMGRINSKNIQWKCKRLLHAQSLSMYMYMYIQTFLDGICLPVGEYCKVIC